MLNVDLPQPDSPTSPSVRPCMIVNDTSVRTCIRSWPHPDDLATWNTFETCSTWTAAPFS